MQLVRQGLDIAGNIGAAVPQFRNMVKHFLGQMRILLTELLQLDRQHREALADIIMKLPGNTGAFVLLCLNQLAVHSGESLFSELAVGNIDARANKASKRTIWIEPGHSKVQNPSIFTVVATQPVLHGEFLTGIKSPNV